MTDTDTVAGPLTGRRAIVTGAAGGIGAAAVRAYLAAGAQVVGLYRNTPPPADLAERCTWVSGDLVDRGSVDQAFQKAVETLGGLDVLVHAAGVWRGSMADTLTEEDYHDVLNRNLLSTILTNQAALARMRETGGGQIVNMGSGEGVRGNQIAPHYAAAKAGVHAWTRSVATAWGRHGVTVNALSPAVSTPGVERLNEFIGPKAAEAMRASLRATMPIRGELGDPLDDLGPVLVFLGGPGARFITGQLVAVNGGLQMLGA